MDFKIHTSLLLFLTNNHLDKCVSFNQNDQIKVEHFGGPHITMIRIIPLHLGSILGIPLNYFLDGSGIY